MRFFHNTRNPTMIDITAFKFPVGPLAAVLLVVSLAASGCARAPERIIPALRADDGKSCEEIHREIESESRAETQKQRRADVCQRSILNWRKHFTPECRINLEALVIEIEEHRDRWKRLEEVENRRCDLNKKETL